MTIWTLAHERTASELTVAKTRITASAPSVGEASVHPGRDWFAVLSGTAELRLFSTPVRQSALAVGALQSWFWIAGSRTATAAEVISSTRSFGSRPRAARELMPSSIPVSK